LIGKPGTSAVRQPKGGAAPRHLTVWPLSLPGRFKHIRDEKKNVPLDFSTIFYEFSRTNPIDGNLSARDYRAIVP
jgi:hypothetical protein